MAAQLTDNQMRVARAHQLIQEIDEDKNPSGPTLQSWLQQKDRLNPSPGKHHKKRNVTRGQIRSDLERLIEALS